MTDQQIDEFLEMLAKSPTSARDMVRGLFAAHEAKAAPAKPFGYFRAEPMGWTDCAETDEGAIALYERPAAPAVPDADELESALERLVERCNTDQFLSNDDAVIHAEATLERIYKSRKSTATPPQPVPFDQWNSSPYTQVLHETIKDLSQKLASMTQSQPVTLTDEWCYSFDEERFHGDCASREEAIAEAKAEAEGNEHTHAWIGKSKHPREFISKKWLGIHIEEYLSERIGDEIGELAELFSLTPEQQEQLGAAAISWVESGPGFRCWAVKDVEEVELADFDESGQIIAALREKEGK